jgi:hypothetical protein
MNEIASAIAGAFVGSAAIASTAWVVVTLIKSNRFR